MEHEHSDDEWGFWEPERTRRPPRVRARDDVTRQLDTVRPGGRRHGEAEPVVDEHDPLGLFDELGPADEFPGLDEPEIPVVSTGPRRWRDRLRRDERGRIDPAVTRLAVLVIAGVIALPVVAASAGGASTRGAAALPAPTALTTTPTAPADPGTVTVATAAPSPSAPSPSATVAPSAAPARSASASQAAATTAAPPPSTAVASSSSPAHSASAVEAQAACSSSYEVLAGDYWLGIADRADVDVDGLLSANGATSDTPLYPGRSICLPAGATTPLPAPTTTAETKPTTTAEAKPTTTAAPPATAAKTTTAAAKPTTTTPKATTAPATTAKPTTTTVAPTTTQPARTYTRDEVAQIIRDVWPDDLEDKAIAIATRESNLVPAVRNFCCFGLFQIYYSVHAGWLGQMGVTTATQLYDPTVNAQAALVLYYRNGGWGPWGG